MSHPLPIRNASRVLCYVTDRRQLCRGVASPNVSLLEKIKEAVNAGVDWIQIREKDLSAAELSELTREAVRLAGSVCRVLVNDRLDVAYAVSAAGVHLGEKSLRVEDARRFVRERSAAANFLIGVSVHSLEAAIAAESGGADYLIFGPVFPTPSKAAFGAPQGLERLKELCRNAAIPVLAIGGITIQNAQECYAAGASGVAAIRLFQDATDTVRVVDQLRENRKA